MQKKIYFLIIILLFTYTKGFTQTDPLRKKLDSIFQYVDKTQIPTGYLKEYGSEFLPLHWFNGLLTDSNTVNSLNIFRTAYCDMVTAKLPTQVINPQARLTIYNTLLPLPQVNNQIDLVANNFTSPIAILYTKYASLKETALSQNLFTVSNQQIYDVPNRTISPYNFNTLFVAAPIKETFTNTVSLKLDTAFFYRNMNVLVTGAFVDFKDGQGYRSLSSAATQKTYTDSSGRKPIIIKVTTNDGNTLLCNSSVLVTVTNNAANRYIDTDPLQANIEVPVVPTDGIGGGDFMQIRYAKNNPTRLQPQQHVRKPLIYVEGYDASNSYDIYKLIRNSPNDDNNGEWLSLITKGYDFMNYLDDVAGYDLVFVNYNTLRSFEDNTKMLQRAIEWVNADKILGTGGTATQNVVLGVSAGGLLARYTLARLTKFVGVNYADTRLLITMDSPHQGANVPLALQHFLYDLGEQSILGNKIKENEKDLKDFMELNLKPATAQLLKARVTSPGVVAINTFLNGPNSPYQEMVRFDSLYNPSNIVPPYKFLAVSQGSQCGVPVTTPSISFASQDGEFAIFRAWFPPTPWTPFIYVTSKWWLTTNLNAIPNSGIANIEYFKFERRIKLWGIGFGWKVMDEVTRQNPAGYVGWDAAPGGTQSIDDRTNGGLSSGLSKKDEFGRIGKIFARLKAGASLTINQDAFSFVSTTSALDAPFGSDPNTIFNFAANGNVNTSTFKYQAQSKEIGSTLFNRNHTDYTPRNALWIYNEMESITQPALTCNDFCTSSITGPSSFCTTATYSFTLPIGSSVSWSVTNIIPAGCVTFQINGNTITLTKVQNGQATITVNSSSSCFSSPTTISKNIIFGGDLAGYYTMNSDPTQFPLTNGTRFITLPRGYSVGLNFYLTNTTNLSNIHWTFDNYYGNSTSFSNSIVASQYGYSNVYKSVNFFADGPCGPVSLGHSFNVMSLGWRTAGTIDSTVSTFTATPNPIQNTLNIKVNSPLNGKVVQTSSYYLINISELNTLLPLKQLRINKTGGDIQINMAGLKSGYYAVEINDGDNKQILKIFKL